MPVCEPVCIVFVGQSVESSDHVMYFQYVLEGDCGCSGLHQRESHPSTVWEWQLAGGSDKELECFR